MRDIIGHNGSQTKASVVFQDFKRVEYRIYVLAGIAGLSNRQLIIKNDTGTLGRIEARHELNSLAGNLAIGHTHWTTNGTVTPINVHSDRDSSNTISVIYNGIIENYQELHKHPGKLVTVRSN